MAHIDLALHAAHPHFKILLFCSKVGDSVVDALELNLQLLSDVAELLDGLLELQLLIVLALGSISRLDSSLNPCVKLLLKLTHPSFLVALQINQLQLQIPNLLVKSTARKRRSLIPRWWIKVLLFKRHKRTRS